MMTMMMTRTKIKVRFGVWTDIGGVMNEDRFGTDCLYRAGRKSEPKVA